jgi:RNase P/RNase MRP subunit POP5
MTTILTFSLRDLFGDFESHSCATQVTKEEEGDGVMIINCPSKSIKEIRAALTLVTPPPYMVDKQYRFDVLDVKKLEPR